MRCALVDGLPQIVVITGLLAAGKSTVGQLLAARLQRSVHLRGDVFRRMIVSGRVDMSPVPDAEALRQLELRYALACQAAAEYAAAGFHVIYQDVILGAALSEVGRRLTSWAPGIVVLTPSLAAIAARDRSRRKSAYGGDWSPGVLARALDVTPRIGLWLDTTALTAEATVGCIVERRSELRRGLLEE